MDFIYSLPAAGQAVFILLFVYWGYVLWRNQRKAMKEYMDADYEPEGPLNEDSWRWEASPPEVGLLLEQEDGLSCLQLQPLRSSNEYIFGIIGLLLAGLTAWMGMVCLLRDSAEVVVPPGMTVGFLMVMAFLAFAFCAADAPVTSIVRTRDRLILKMRFAVFFHRKKVYRAKRAKRMVFKGSIQGLLEMNTDQLDRLPDFNLYVGRRFLPSKRYLLRCTPTQARWIVVGLNRWKEAVTAMINN